MVDRVSASITIGGIISVSLWQTLSAAIAAEALSTDWDGEPFNDSDIPEGQPLRLYAHEVANGTFKELEPICQAHGVPFVRSSYGFTGQWGPEKVVFTGTGDPIKGCDAIAAAWAAQAGVPIVTFAPNAQRFGKSAGFKRNDQLVSLRPVEAIICQGTGIQSHLLDELKGAGVPTHAFRYDAQAPMPADAKRQNWG